MSNGDFITNEIVLKTCIFLLGFLFVWSYCGSTTSVNLKRKEAIDTLPHLVTADREAIKEIYEPFFDYIADQTNLEPAFIYAYFIYETGGDSELWRDYQNPGGIKAKHGPKYWDDCQGKCTFADLSGLTIRQVADRWSEVFNIPRYKRCKGKSLPQCFECFMEQGYHSSKRWKPRYQIALTYGRAD